MNHTVSQIGFCDRWLVLLQPLLVAGVRLPLVCTRASDSNSSWGSFLIYGLYEIESIFLQTRHFIHKGTVGFLLLEITVSLGRPAIQYSNQRFQVPCAISLDFCSVCFRFFFIFAVVTNFRLSNCETTVPFPKPLDHDGVISLCCGYSKGVPWSGAYYQTNAWKGSGKILAGIARVFSKAGGRRQRQWGRTTRSPTQNSPWSDFVPTYFNRETQAARTIGTVGLQRWRKTNQRGWDDSKFERQSGEQLGW